MRQRLPRHYHRCSVCGAPATTVARDYIVKSTDTYGRLQVRRSKRPRYGCLYHPVADGDIFLSDPLADNLRRIEQFMDGPPSDARKIKRTIRL